MATDEIHYSFSAVGEALPGKLDCGHTFVKARLCLLRPHYLLGGVTKFPQCLRFAKVMHVFSFTFPNKLMDRLLLLAPVLQMRKQRLAANQSPLQVTQKSQPGSQEWSSRCLYTFVLGDQGPVNKDMRAVPCLLNGYHPKLKKRRGEVHTHFRQSLAN